MVDPGTSSAANPGGAALSNWKTVFSNRSKTDCFCKVPEPTKHSTRRLSQGVEQHIPLSIDVAPHSLLRTNGRRRNHTDCGAYDTQNERKNCPRRQLLGRTLFRYYCSRASEGSGQGIKLLRSTAAHYTHCARSCALLTLVPVGSIRGDSDTTGPPLLQCFDVG